MTARLILRPATTGDAIALAEIHAASKARPWPAADFAQQLALPTTFGWLAIDTAVPAAALGFILVSIVAADSEILTLAVRPAARRHGIGARLLAQALGAAETHGVRRMTLEVAADNGAALALYEAAGFCAAGRRARYYERPGGKAADALVLARSIG